MKKRYLAWITGVLMVGVATQKVKAQSVNMFLTPPANTTFKNFAEALPEMNWETPLETTDFQAYLNFYHLDFAHTTHYAGTLKDHRSRRLFVHVLKNNTQPVKGTLFAHHGYFVHSAMLKYLIERALQENYQVVVADLPGHGLSEGSQASIDDFSDYAQIIEEITPLIQAHLPKPYYLMGHSTGGAGVWEYALKTPYNPYQKIVLGAPLVRSYLWEWSAAGFYLGRYFLPEVPRLLKPTTRDPEFLAVTLSDPLQYGRTPIQWLKALIHWNDNVIQNYPPSSKSMLILQGTDDSVVESSYNIPFLEKKFPLATIQWVKDCRHDMFWEIKPMRDKVLDYTFDYLNASD